MQIDWWTLALQAINFVVLVWLLSHFLYRPVKAVIEKRRELAEAAFAEADKQKAEADLARKQFEDNKSALAEEREAILKKLHQEVESERRIALDKAKEEAQHFIDGGRSTIREEREAARKEIREQASGLAVDLAALLLREMGAELSNAAYLEVLKKHLVDLPEAERKRLRKDLSTDTARLNVVTAVPLSREERDHWAETIGAIIGGKDRTEFTSNDALLGGAELRFPHAVLKFTWADQLEKAKALLDNDETVA